MGWKSIPPGIVDTAPFQIIERESLRAVAEAGVLTRDVMTLTTPFGGTGLTGDSWQLIQARIDAPGRYLGGAITSNTAALVLEEGANYPPGRKPPASRLTVWVRRKLGIADEKKIRSVSHAVANAIARRGLPGPGRSDKIFSAAFEEIRPKIEAIMGRASQRIAAQISRD
ncbi:hypothetical protein LCGC14_2591770 [marine sediment metagenome]|uniref:Uncharacterized protein n=1 Tax=marine sediment metagenome TaxID=412755 RepID=A0A0F9D450_9ZZZZ